LINLAADEETYGFNVLNNANWTNFWKI